MSSDSHTNQRLVDNLTAAFPEPSRSDIEALRNRLSVAADQDDLLDVAYRTVDSPLGPLLVAATADGLVRVAFDREGHGAVLAHLAAAISPRILRSDRRTDDVARQLDEYFGGRRRHFDVPVDLRLVDGFRRTVISHLRHIAYGATESYRDVAVAAGSPKAVRAVGTACAHNPVPLVIPCHRVIRHDGSMGQYRGGPEAKAALLAMEAAA